MEKALTREEMRELDRKAIEGIQNSWDYPHGKCRKECGEENLANVRRHTKSKSGHFVWERE